MCVFGVYVNIAGVCMMLLVYASDCVCMHLIVCGCILLFVLLSIVCAITVLLFASYCFCLFSFVSMWFPAYQGAGSITSNEHTQKVLLMSWTYIRLCDFCCMQFAIETVWVPGQRIWIPRIWAAGWCIWTTSVRTAKSIWGRGGCTRTSIWSRGISGTTPTSILNPVGFSDDYSIRI